MHYLIDADSVAVRAALMSLQMIDHPDTSWVDIGFHTETIEAEFDALLDQWIKIAEELSRTPPTEVILCYTSNERCFRKDISPTYKANRLTRKKPQGWQYLVDYSREKYPTLMVHSLEADDILGIAATSGDFNPCIILSIDKDLRTIPGQLVNPDKETLEEIDHETARYNHMYQTIIGDSTDGYPGIPGVGPVGAKRVLDESTSWSTILKLAEKHGLTEEELLVQARLAKILTDSYWNRETLEVTLWEPTE